MGLVGVRHWRNERTREERDEGDCILAYERSRLHLIEAAIVCDSSNLSRGRSHTPQKTCWPHGPARGCENSKRLTMPCQSIAWKSIEFRAPDARRPNGWTIASSHAVVTT